MERVAAVAASVALLPRKTFGRTTGARLSLAWRKVVAAGACGVLLAAAGCGGAEGVAENALLSAYVSAPLCLDAKQELVEQGGRAGDVRVRAVCVGDVGAAGESRLAAIGAAARRASEDSSSVAYVGTPEPVAVRFSEPILEEAGIVRISSRSGAAAMERVLRALRGSGDAASLREAVYERLG
jgi:hypothetical protein